MSTLRVSLSLTPLGADFVHAPGSAQRAWACRDGLLIRASAEGMEGLGEASPLEGMSVETAADVEGALAALGPSLSIDEVAPGESLVLPRLPPSARFGLETALADLLAQRDQLSLARWLAPQEARRRVRTQTLLDRLDGLGGLHCIFELGAMEAGQPAVKVKIGRRDRVAEEQGLLRALRAEYPDCVIRADANAMPIAPELLETLVEVGCALLEDPCPLELLGTRSWPLPIALDEPLYSDPDGAMEAIAEGHASAVVLKPSLIGGLAACRALAKRARSLGAQAIVSHALESPIAMCAAAHLALSFPEDEIHGLGRWEGLERFEVEGTRIAVPKWIGVTRLEPPDEPGLGIRL